MVDRLEAEPVSLLAAWRAFLALRRRHPALRSGSIEIIETQVPVLGFRRRAAGETLTVLLNLSDEPTDVDCSGFGPIEPVPDIDFPAVLSAGRVRLEPYGYLVCSG